MSKANVFPNFEAVQVAQIEAGDLILYQDEGTLLPHLAATPLSGGRGAVLAKLFGSFESFLLSSPDGVVLRLLSHWRFSLKFDAPLPAWRADDVPRGKIGVTDGAQFFASCSGMGFRQNAPISLFDYSLLRTNGSCAYFDWNIEVRGSDNEPWVPYYAPCTAEQSK